MCFTADRGGDQQRGAALRCLRDLDRPDLKGKLENALSEPINKVGRRLGDAIHRIRNEALIHHSFDFENQGGALLHVGEPDQEMAALAFETLAEAVREVLAEVKQEKVTLIAKMLVEGTLAEYSSSIDAAPARARDKEREHRRAQRSETKERWVSPEVTQPSGWHGGGNRYEGAGLSTRWPCHYP